MVNFIFAGNGNRKANKRGKAQFPLPWNKSTDFLSFLLKHRGRQFSLSRLMLHVVITKIVLIKIVFCRNYSAPNQDSSEVASIQVIIVFCQSLLFLIRSTPKIYLHGFQSIGKENIYIEMATTQEYVECQCFGPGRHIKSSVLEIISEVRRKLRCS